MRYVLLVVLLAASGMAEDRSLWVTAGVQAGAVALDGISTFSCGFTREEGMPWLYGKELRPARVSLVLAGEVVVGVAVGYLLKKRHKRMWRVLMLADSGSHLVAAGENFKDCR